MIHSGCFKLDLRIVQKFSGIVKRVSRYISGTSFRLIFDEELNTLLGNQISNRNRVYNKSRSTEKIVLKMHSNQHTRMKTKRLYAYICSLGIFTMSAFGAGAPRVKTIEHNEYISIEHIARNHNMHLSQPTNDSLIIKNSTRGMTFHPGQRKTFFHGITVFLNGPIEKAHGKWYVTQVDRKDIVDPLLHPSRHLEGYECERIVLDPGHGGRDPGAASPRGLQEKQLTLDIAKKVARILRSEGLAVHLTRKSDKYLQPGFRPRIAKHEDADIFVSIHLNSAANSTARGIETYRLTASGFPSVQSANEESFNPAKYKGNGYNGANTLLGYHIQSALHSITESPDRGLRHARFAVLKDAPCPAVLVECGFLCNSHEEQLLSSPDYRNRIAAGIATGILRYRSTTKRARLDE